MLPGFRGAMAFLNLLTLFHRERVAGAAILSLLREGGPLEGKGKGGCNTPPFRKGEENIGHDVQFFK